MTWLKDFFPSINTRVLKTMKTHFSNMSENIEEKVIKFVAEGLGLDERTIHPNSKLIEELGADSLDLVELWMTIEAAFEIDIPDEITETFKTVGDVVKYLKEKIHD